jgi:hypothetical protein
MKLTTVALLTLCLTSSSAFAQAGRSGAEPGVLESHSGQMEMVNRGQTVVIKLAGAPGTDARWFRVETSSPAPLPRSFSAARAEVFYWRGQLLLLAVNEGKAFYFSMPDFKPGRVLPPPSGTPGPPVRSTPDLETVLAGYDVIYINTTTEITSAQGPRALAVIEGRGVSTKQFTPPPNPGGGGIGTCGSTCSITCGDQSTCSATCTSPRCASCTCPASCVCN